MDNPKVKKILVIGDAMTDRYIFANTSRKSPEDSNVPIYDVKEVEDRPGGAFNVAANLTSITDDFIVNVSAIVSKEQAYIKSLHRWCSYTDFPIVKQRVIDDKSMKQVIRMDYRKTFDRASIVEFCNPYQKDANAYIYQPDVDAVVISDYCKGTIQPEIVKWLETLTVPVFVDTKDPNMARWRKIYNCIVKLNEKEYTAARYRSSVAMVVTLGKYGSVFRPRRWEKDDVHMPSPEIHDADVVGAGDAYLAGFVVGYLASHSKIEEAMLLGTQVASASCRHFGTHVVSKQELKDEQLGYVRQAKLG